MPLCVLWWHSCWLLTRAGLCGLLSRALHAGQDSESCLGSSAVSWHGQVSLKVAGFGSEWLKVVFPSCPAGPLVGHPSMLGLGSYLYGEGTQEADPLDIMFPYVCTYPSSLCPKWHDKVGVGKTFKLFSCWYHDSVLYSRHELLGQVMFISVSGSHFLGLVMCHWVGSYCSFSANGAFAVYFFIFTYRGLG